MQAGVWDVDGTGMQAVDDPEVDLGIRKVGASSWSTCPLKPQHDVYTPRIDCFILCSSGFLCFLGLQVVHWGV